MKQQKISNYRPISLLNSIFKIWEKILYFKLQEELSPSVIHCSQFGSQKGIGAVDAILALNLIKDNNKEFPLFSASIDLSKAYNRVNRKNYGVNLNF